MSLNTKNERTHALVRELAQRTGRSQTSAVEEAVRRHLADIGVDVEAETRADRLRVARSVVAAYRADVSEEDAARILLADHDLYDEIGVPDDRGHLGAGRYLARGVRRRTSPGSAGGIEFRQDLSGNFA